MAEDIRGFALEKAELLSSRLKEILSTGQGYIQARFGVDLGLKPELYPTWIILSTAAAGLLVLLGLSWAAVCGGGLPGKKRGYPAVSQGVGQPDKAVSAKSGRAEEQRKRNRKKALDKKTQSNGQPVTVAQEEIHVTEAVSKLASLLKTDKTQVQVKKSKKKPKTDVKPVQFTNDGKEPDDGAWETKVSNREKKQQRRKDKGGKDCGSPGGVGAPKSSVEPSVVTAVSNNKKNRGNHEAVQSRNTGKGDAASGGVSSSRRDEPSVNGGGWTDISMKMRGMGAPKWDAIHTATHYRAPPKHQSWTQETQAWSGVDGQIKTELKPVSLSVLGRNATESVSNSMELRWVSQPDVDDEWSGFNGMATVDPSSDWNAPVEHWGNYEEVVVIPAPPPKEQLAPNKISEDEKDVEDPSSGAAKSKKKRKKKKKAEEECAPEAQTVNAVPQELPILASKKQNPSIISSSQKKSEQPVEPPKPSQKKKVRRET